MENRLCSEEDFLKSQELHDIYEKAREERGQAQPHIDELQRQFEDCAARLAASERSSGTPAARLEQLRQEVKIAESKRDKGIREVDEPVTRARNGIVGFDGPFFSAAIGWLGFFAEYDFEHALVELIKSTRKQIETMYARKVSLRELSEFFVSVQQKIEAWQFSKPPEGIFTGITRPRHMLIPRLSDFLRP